MQELESTILSGWPFKDFPTDEEARIIESTYHELMLRLPTLGDEWAWIIAGGIVARLRRDRSSSGEQPPVPRHPG